MRPRSQRIGVLGGTFDPIHLGHLRTAEEMAFKMDLDRVLVIPAGLPPHKTHEPLSPYPHRLEMARLACEPSPVLEVSDLEGKRGGPSYSIETLKELKGKFGPMVELFFILGTDAFEEIDTWKDYEGLFSLSNFVVVQRPGFGLHTVETILTRLGIEYREAKERMFALTSGKAVFLREATFMDISSTNIRALVKKGLSIRFLVPDAVLNYIEQTRLYREQEST